MMTAADAAAGAIVKDHDVHKTDASNFLSAPTSHHTYSGGLLGG